MFVILYSLSLVGGSVRVTCNLPVCDQFSEKHSDGESFEIFGGHYQVSGGVSDQCCLRNGHAELLSGAGQVKDIKRLMMTS